MKKQIILDEQDIKEFHEEQRKSYLWILTRMK